MATKEDDQVAEASDHMRHVNHFWREQIVWRARVIRKAEDCKARRRETMT
ncbi:MAG TPA: hypothetical protein PK178_10700 [Smithellaceae bacterium]|nr:hypothetical protein [Desulfovermiculus halophilus]HOQ42612.1 hypothetical protein [Smithellaceae bacterium]